MAPTGAWDMDQWKAELEKHMQVQPVVVQSVVSYSTYMTVLGADILVGTVHLCAFGDQHGAPITHALAREQCDRTPSETRPITATASARDTSY